MFATFHYRRFHGCIATRGSYGHAGGLAHSTLHGIGAFAVLAFSLGAHAWVFALTDAAFHYHIDWTKMNANQKLNLEADNSKCFWILLGFDQLLHHLTYFGIIAFVFKAHV